MSSRTTYPSWRRAFNASSRWAGEIFPAAHSSEPMVIVIAVSESSPLCGQLLIHLIRGSYRAFLCAAEDASVEAGSPTPPPAPPLTGEGRETASPASPLAFGGPSSPSTKARTAEPITTPRLLTGGARISGAGCPADGWGSRAANRRSQRLSVGEGPVPPLLRTCSVSRCRSGQLCGGGAGARSGPAGDAARPGDAPIPASDSGVAGVGLIGLRPSGGDG